MKTYGVTVGFAELEQLKKALEREKHPLVRQIIKDKIEELEGSVRKHEVFTQRCP